jgi:hypothetical protein
LPLALTLTACAGLMKNDPPPDALGPLFCDVAVIIAKPNCASLPTAAKIDANNRMVTQCPAGSRARASVP